MNYRAAFLTGFLGAAIVLMLMVTVGYVAAFAFYGVFTAILIRNFLRSTRGQL